MQSCYLHILFQKEDGFISEYAVNSKGMFLNHKFQRQKKTRNMLSPFFHQYEVHETRPQIPIQNTQSQIPIQNTQSQIPIQNSTHTINDNLFDIIFVEDVFDNPFLDDFNFSNL